MILMTYITQKIKILYSLKLERDQARLIPVVVRRLNFVLVKVNKKITITILWLCPKIYLMARMMIIMISTKMIMIIIKMMLKNKESSKR